jgi:cyclophilin family peptidyl-prolyl cis-trans isomerase
VTRDRWIFLSGLLGAAAVAVVLVLLLRDDEESGSTTTAGGACAEVEEPAPKEVRFDEPEPVLERGQQATATVKTNCGTFEIELDTEISFKTANSFAFLAEEGFYDGTTFHRIVPGFVIQGGDPKGTGTGGPGYSVTEPPPQRTEYLNGVVAMAKTEVEPPGASGSQFYVVTAPADAGLPPDYAVLGEVSSGMDVVEAIEGVETDSADRPLQPVVIDSITVS